MSLPKLLGITALLLFGVIGFVAFFKTENTPKVHEEVPLASGPLEVELDQEIHIVNSSPTPLPQTLSLIEPQASEPTQNGVPVAKKINSEPTDGAEPPEANRIEELFNKGEPKLPIVETITYKSRVTWQKGRPAWLSDYATYYNTSRHFIARSLNGKPDYFKQDVAEGDRFNVLAKDKKINFHLLIDISRCKLWLYCHDLDTNERILLKTYQVGLGRSDSSKTSGLLTPLGKYTLGEKIAIYKPKMLGNYHGEKVEMIRVFGTRWIPFDKEVQGCTAPAKGFGIHGLPWMLNEKGTLVQDRQSLGKYESDGCIRLATEDVEEIFAIIITKPTTIELVRNYYEAKLPGVDK